MIDVSPRRWLASDIARLLVLAALVRLAWWFAMASDPARFFEPDSSGYVSLATSLSSGDGFAALGSNTPEFVRTPGYPGFLAIIQWIFGDSARVLALVQALVTSLFVVPLHRIAKTFLDRRAANIVVGLMALHPLILYHSTMLLTEALSLLLVMVVVDRLIRHVRDVDQRLQAWVVTGGWLALLAQVRPIAYFLAPIVVVAMFWIQFRRQQKAAMSIRRVAALLIVPLIAIGGWQVRNKVEVDSWRFSGIEAVNMYLYRAAGVIGYREGRSWLEVREELRADFGEPRPGEQQGVYYDRMYGEGLDIVLDDVPAAAAMTLRGLADTALGDSRDPDRFLSYFDLQSQTFVTWGMWTVMTSIWLLAGWGVISARRRGLGSAALLIAVVLVYMVALSAGPEAYSRFRTPVEPLLWVMAALGLAGLRERGKYPEIS